MTRGGFTLSLDCEGLWGMADQKRVVTRRAICDDSLQDAYHLISKVLETHQIKATCAFVSAFAAGPAILRENMELLQDLASECPEWFTHVMPALHRADYDGWFGSHFYAALRSGGHEMAWHGGTHLSLANATPATAIALELKLSTALLNAIGDEPKTIVFPRNHVGHLPELHRAGFKTYREGRSGGVLVKISNLASEWKVWDARVDALPYGQNGWQVSPAGFFLNWPSGIRAAVPTAVTVSRWKNLLRNAAKRAGYVHMWFHPHNLITAPRMRTAFEQIIAEAGQLVRSGDLVSLTMAEAYGHFERTADRRRTGSPA